MCISARRNKRRNKEEAVVEYSRGRSRSEVLKKASLDFGANWALSVQLQVLVQVNGPNLLKQVQGHNISQKGGV
jgi:hypothetical protein